MSKKDQLRKQRTGTIINATSAKQESDLYRAMNQVVESVIDKFGSNLNIRHMKQWMLKDIVFELRKTYPDTDFYHYSEASSIRPDGGILYLQRTEDDFIYPILIAEVKNQGTNDLRAKEGLQRQARGNAIERLGKNLIGLRVALKRESIFPFVCFGYGCDFEPKSSILDRVSTMAMFGRLNFTHLYDDERGIFDRGSFYFREQAWTILEMVEIMQDIAFRSVLYYRSKYGDAGFFDEGDKLARR